MKRQAAGCWREAVQSPSLEDIFSLVATCCLAKRREPVSANKDVLSLAQPHVTSGQRQCQRESQDQTAQEFIENQRLPEYYSYMLGN